MIDEPGVIPIGEEPPAMDTPERPADRRTWPAGNGRLEAPPKRPGGAARRRFALLNAIADAALPRFKARTDLAVWLVLFRHAKPDGMVTASIGDLAKRTGSSYRSVQYALDRLQAAGLVERIKRGTLAGGPSVWRLIQPY